MKNQNFLRKFQIYILVLITSFLHVEKVKPINDKDKTILAIVGSVLGVAAIGTGIYLFSRARRAKVAEELKNAKTPADTQKILDQTNKDVAKDLGYSLKAQEIQTVKEEGRIPNEAQISTAVDNLVNSDLVQDQIKAQVNNQADIAAKAENLSHEIVQQPIQRDNANIIADLKSKLTASLENSGGGNAEWLPDALSKLDALKTEGVDVVDFLVKSNDFRKLAPSDMWKIVSSIDKKSPNLDALRKIPQNVEAKKNKAIKLGLDASRRLYESNLGKGSPEIQTRLQIDDFRFRYLEKFLSRQRLTENQVLEALKDKNINKTLQDYKDKLKISLDIPPSELTNFETNISKIFGENISPQAQAENVQLEAQKPQDVQQAEQQLVQIDIGPAPKPGYKSLSKALIEQIKTFNRDTLKITKTVKNNQGMSDMEAAIVKNRINMEHDFDEQINSAETADVKPEKIVEKAKQSGLVLSSDFITRLQASIPESVFSIDPVTYLKDQGITAEIGKTLAGPQPTKIGDYIFKFDPTTGKLIDSMPFDQFTEDNSTAQINEYDPFVGEIGTFNIGGFSEPIGGMPETPSYIWQSGLIEPPAPVMV